MKKNIDSIAFQGEKGAYQELVCQKYFPNHKAIACKNFEEVFFKVEKNNVNIGIVPIENSYVGRVSEIHNILRETKLFITGEYFIEINHCLATHKNNSIKDIDTITSHPMALMQCRKKISAFNWTEQKEVNTAIAAKKLYQNPAKNLAVICSKAACELYDLKILDNNFQDSNENFTHFISLETQPKNLDKTVNAIGTIMFTLKNSNSALYNALGVFAKSNVNITKIESYIPGGISKQADFLLSFEGNPHDNNIKVILESLQNYTYNIKILGFYQASNVRESI